MLNTEFNSLDAATQGLISGNSFTTSVQGLLTIIEIEPVPPSPPSIISRIGGSFTPPFLKPKEKKTKFKIKVTVFKGNQKFTEEKIIKAIKEPKVSDVNVTLGKKDKITISVKDIK